MAKHISSEMAAHLSNNDIVYSGAEFNLWIDDCPVIRGRKGVFTVQQATMDVGLFGTIKKIFVPSQKEYRLEFTVNSQDLGPEQFWFFKFNNSMMVGASKPSIIKTSIIGITADPLMLVGTLHLAEVTTDMGITEFKFQFVGYVPIGLNESLSNKPNIYAADPIPEVNDASGSMEIVTSIAIPASESMSASPSEESYSYSPSEEDYSYSESGEPVTPEVQDYQGPSVQEQAEDLEAQLKILLEKMEKQKIKTNNRKVSFN